jgi:hypothetical protein
MCLAGGNSWWSKKIENWIEELAILSDIANAHPQYAAYIKHFRYIKKYIGRSGK